MRQARLLALVLLGLRGLAVGQDTSAAPPAKTERATGMRIQLTSGRNEPVIVRLNDSEAARDFVSLLPLRLTFKDHARTEKVSDLPRSLTSKGAPPGFDPSVGDLAYYAPWKNLALYYRDFGYSDGLVPLGAVESGSGSLAHLEGEVLVEVAREPVKGGRVLIR
jgi:hypothetical protein